MKINLAVIFGGKSTEHDVSIISALQSIENLDKDKYEIIPIFIDKLGDFYYHKQLLLDAKNFKNQNLLIKSCDKITFVKNGNKVTINKIEKKLFSNDIISEVDIVLPVVHGTNVEDGNLQGYLHTLGLPFVGCDTLSSSIGMDKYVMKQFLNAEGLPVIPGFRFDINDYKNIDNLIRTIEEKLIYPVIIKPVNLGSSIGITKADNISKLKESLDLAFSFSNQVIVEKAIVNMRELNCAVLGDRFDCMPSAVEEPFGNDEILSFQDKYLSGVKSSKTGSKITFSGSKSSGSATGAKSGMASLKRQVPANIPTDLENTVKELATKAFKVIGCSGVSRIDFIYDKNEEKIYINEINTIPGSLSYYLFTPIGIEYKDLLDRLIKIALDNHRREENLQFSFESSLL